MNSSVMRIKTETVNIRGVKIGFGHPIVIQSMTNTDTSAAKKTAHQCIELANSGSEIVRITVNDESAAASIPKIRKILDDKGYNALPLVGDFHYNGHTLLTHFPKCAKTLDKYRINPGNVGYGDKHNYNMETLVKVAKENDKVIRIGVNWGSLDRELLTQCMNKNAKRKNPEPDKEVLIEAMVESAMRSAELAEKVGMKRNKIVLSVKMSIVQDVVKAYELLAKRMKNENRLYALHLGLTEAGSGLKGIITSTAAISILLQKGIGDTIRISLTPSLNQKRTEEVEACKTLLQALDFRHFKPQITSCPGCGRSANDFFLRLTSKINEHVNKKMPEWKKKYKGVENMSVSVMGCIVNGPGESMHADIGISLPGKGEQNVAQVFQKGKYLCSLKGNNIEEQFIKILEAFIQKEFKQNLVSSRK